MDEKLETAEKKALVEIVKIVQQQGLEGTQGGWKDFLKTNDKKFGASLSDPSRRSHDILVSFLKTFTKDEDLKLFSRVLQSHSNRNVVEQLKSKPRDDESPEQGLVRLTREHPDYLIDYAFPSADEGWIVTKPSKRSRAMTSNAMIAVDCEMVLCEDGTEALVRVCAVDRELQVKIDELVKPEKPVADYRTDITGVAAGDLDGVTCSLADIQKSLKKLLSGGTILVGHSVHFDLLVLKINHARVIDTSYIFKYLGASIYRKPSLNNLCKSILGYEVRKPGAAHDCLDDAFAAMKVVLARLERGEITLVHDIPQPEREPEREKLLVHKIPVYVRREDISRVIPRAVAVEVKPSKKLESRYYSAFAVFNSPQEANQAYENMEGDEEKDSSRLSQKLVSFQFGDGVTASVYIRKMAPDESNPEVSSNKRAFEGVDKSTKSKKLKTDDEIVEETMEDTNQLSHHLKEIERLKQDHLKEIERLKQDHLKELKMKDAKIALQDKMLSNLISKVEKSKVPDKKNKKK